MPMGLGALPRRRRSGAECFRNSTEVLPFTLLDFWQWSVSDIVSNATRGVLAEYLVARALGLDPAAVREEWASWDLTMPTGFKLEVKSASYVQSWGQSRFSSISFSIAPSRAWSASTGKMETAARRQADAYVFALLHHQDKPTIDPLDVSQWTFFVVAATALDKYERSNHSITLRSLQMRCGQNHSLWRGPADFSSLGTDVDWIQDQRRDTVG